MKDLREKAEEKCLVASVGEVREQMSTLSEALDMLNDVASELIDSLAPVCSGGIPAKWNEEEPMEDICGLADEIRGKRFSVERITEELQCAINTLQL